MCVCVQVLDTCWKRETESSNSSSLRFSCSTTDVLSCVIHVISKGYLRRQEESPHILEFLPEDPHTPQKGQAQFTFSSSSGSRADLKSPTNANATTAIAAAASDHHSRCEDHALDIELALDLGL